MYNCKICNDNGYVLGTNGDLNPCLCRLHDRWDKYLRPIMGLISSSNKNKIKVSELINCNQVITNTAENIAGLMKLILSDWFPDDFVITSLEELNAMGFDRHDTFKSIHEFTSNFKYFIVDITIINKIRARSPGWNNNDIMCLLDLVKTVMPTCQKVIIIIKPGMSEFAKYYHELCNGLNDFGIEYFNTGKYKKIPANNIFQGEDNE